MLPALAEVPLDGFETTLVNALALAVCHSGPLDSGCLDLAVEFIRSEDRLPSSAATLERLFAAMEQLNSDAAKAAVLLKNRQSKLVAEMQPLDPARREQLGIMLKAMQDAAGNARPKVAELAQKVAAAVARR